MAADKAKKRYVNKGRPVYFSYARNSAKRPGWEHISDCVEDLLSIFDKENIEYRLDKKDIATGDKISDFEREIGWKSEAVVLIFSDKYFRSPHCMYEFVQIKKSLEHYPQKRLLCIKSGDFNLSDINYVMDLERFWNTKKQEYEEIEFHRLRKHSGTEQAAFENGFYLEDVRQLYSFFSAINYQYANSIDWQTFINDIRNYYTTTPKPNLKALYRAQNKFKIKPIHIFAVLGGIFGLLALVALLFAIFAPKKEKKQHAAGLSHPVCTQGTDNYFITYINATEDETELRVHFINDSDTDREIYASKDFTIIADGKEYKMKKADSIATLPDKIKVAKGNVLDFTMKFPPIPPNSVSIDFKGGEYNIDGVQLLRREKPSTIAPYVSSGNYGPLTIHELEINPHCTVLHFLYKNTSDKDVWISLPKDPFLYAKPKKIYKLKKTSGIANLPDSTLVPKGTSIGYAMIFAPIDTTGISKFDYVSSMDKTTGKIEGFFGINVKK